MFMFEDSLKWLIVAGDSRYRHLLPMIHAPIHGDRRTVELYARPSYARATGCTRLRRACCRRCPRTRLHASSEMRAFKVDRALWELPRVHAHARQRVVCAERGHARWRARLDVDGSATQ